MRILGIFAPFLMDFAFFRFQKVSLQEICLLLHFSKVADYAMVQAIHVIAASVNGWHVSCHLEITSISPLWRACAE